MRVPPDQSGVAAGGPLQRQVGVGHRRCSGEAGQAGGEHERLGARRPHRAVQQVQVGAGVGLHRAGHVGEEHEPPGAVAAAGDGPARPGRRPCGGTGAGCARRSSRSPRAVARSAPVRLDAGRRPAQRGDQRPQRRQLLRRSSAAKSLRAAAAPRRWPRPGSRPLAVAVAAGRRAAAVRARPAPLTVRPGAARRRVGAPAGCGGGRAGAFGSPRSSATSTMPPKTWANTAVEHVDLLVRRSSSVTRPSQ